MYEKNMNLCSKLSFNYPLLVRIMTFMNYILFIYRAPCVVFIDELSSYFLKYLMKSYAKNLWRIVIFIISKIQLTPLRFFIHFIDDKVKENINFVSFGIEFFFVSQLYYVSKTSVGCFGYLSHEYLTLRTTVE